MRGFGGIRPRVGGLWADARVASNPPEHPKIAKYPLNKPFSANNGINCILKIFPKNKKGLPVGNKGIEGILGRKSAK